MGCCDEVGLGVVVFVLEDFICGDVDFGEYVVVVVDCSIGCVVLYDCVLVMYF